MAAVPQPAAARDRHIETNGAASAPRPVLPAWVARAASRVGFTLLSVGLFCALWELLWALGISDARLLPPPHVFLSNFPEQAKFFNTAQRWQVGVGLNTGPSPAGAVMITIAASAARVFAGLLIASTLSITIGVLIRYYVTVEKLALPTITLLSPVSPIAWLPVAIFLFGIGDAPAIFMVVVALFFHMVLATISQIDQVNRNLINVARTMGATKFQTYSRVIMLARNAFNPSLVFFTIALIGVLGFTSDWALRMVQKRILYWVPETTGVLRGL